MENNLIQGRCIVSIDPRIGDVLLSHDRLLTYVRMSACSLPEILFYQIVPNFDHLLFI